MDLNNVIWLLTVYVRKSPQTLVNILVYDDESDVTQIKYVCDSGVVFKYCRLGD